MVGVIGSASGRARLVERLSRRQRQVDCMLYVLDGWILILSGVYSLFIQSPGDCVDIPQVRS